MLAIAFILIVKILNKCAKEYIVEDLTVQKHSILFLCIIANIIHTILVYLGKEAI